MILPSCLPSVRNMTPLLKLFSNIPLMVTIFVSFKHLFSFSKTAAFHTTRIIMFFPHVGALTKPGACRFFGFCILFATASHFLSADLFFLAAVKLPSFTCYMICLTRPNAWTLWPPFTKRNVSLLRAWLVLVVWSSLVAVHPLSPTKATYFVSILI